MRGCIVALSLVAGCSFVLDDDDFAGLRDVSVTLEAIDPATRKPLGPTDDVRTVHPLTAGPSGRDGQGEAVDSFVYTWESWGPIAANQSCETEPDAADVVKLQDLGAELDATHTAKHQCWRVRVRAVRGDRFGPEAVSQAVRIVNSPPSVRSIALSAYQPMVGDTVRAYPAGIEDADGDVVSTRVSWSAGGSAQVGPTFTVSNLTEIEVTTTVTDEENASDKTQISARPIARAPTWYPIAPSVEKGTFSAPDPVHNRVLTTDAAQTLWEYRLDEPRGWTPLSRAPASLHGGQLTARVDGNLILVTAIYLLQDNKPTEYWLLDTRSRGEEVWCEVTFAELCDFLDERCVSGWGLHEGLLFAPERTFSAEEGITIDRFAFSDALQNGCPEDGAPLEVVWDYAPADTNGAIAGFGSYWAKVPGRREAYYLGGTDNENFALKVTFDGVESGQPAQFTEIALGVTLPTVGAGLAYDDARQRFDIMGGVYADTLAEVLSKTGRAVRGVFTLDISDGVVATEVTQIPEAVTLAPRASLASIAGTDDLALATTGDSNGGIWRIGDSNAMSRLEQRSHTSPRTFAFAGAIHNPTHNTFLGGLTSSVWQSWSFDNHDRVWAPIEAAGPSFRLSFGSMAPNATRHAFFGGLLDISGSPHDGPPTVRGPYAPAELWELRTEGADEYAWRRYNFTDGHAIGPRAGHVMIDATGGPNYPESTPRFLIAGGHQADNGPSTQTTLVTCPSVDTCVTESYPDFPAGAYAQVGWSEHAERFIAVGGSEAGRGEIFDAAPWDVSATPWDWRSSYPTADPNPELEIGTPYPRSGAAVASWRACDGEPDRVFAVSGLRTDITPGLHAYNHGFPEFEIGTCHNGFDDEGRPMWIEGCDGSAADVWMLEVGEEGLSQASWTKLLPQTPFGRPGWRFGHASAWNESAAELSIFSGLSVGFFISSTARLHSHTDSWVLRGLDTLAAPGACP